MTTARILLVGCERSIPPDLSPADCAAAIESAIPEADVSVSEDLDDALAMDRGPPDCVLSGLSFPDQGLNLLERLAALERAVPVVHLAASTEESVPAGAFECGVADCVCPTCNDEPLSVLVSGVSDVLERSQQDGNGGSNPSATASTTSGPDYREVVEHLPDPVYALDEDGRFTFVNEAFETVAGREGADIIGEHASAVLSADDVAAGQQLISDLLSSGRSDGTYEMELVTADGETVPTENHVALLPAGEDEFRGTVGIVRDITERKEAKRKLQRTEQRYRRITEQNLFGIYIVQDDEIKYANPRAADLFGYDPEELPGLSVRRVVAEKDHDRLREHLRRRLEGEATEAQYELTGVRKDGSTFEFEVHSGLIEFDGEPAILGALVDISERRERLEELERYETLLRAVPDAVYAFDEAGYIRLYNPSGLEQYGLDEEDIEAGVHFTDLVADEDVPRLVETTRRLLSEEYETDEKAVVRSTAVTADGRRFPAENHFSLMTAEDGAFRGTAGITRDITEREQRQERLQVLDRVLRHNLRNELNVVITTVDGIAERLRTEHDDPESARMAEEATASARDLVEMSNEVRRIQEALERDQVEVGPVDAVGIIESVARQYREAYPAATIDLDVPARTYVTADETLEIALEQLVENAIVHNDGDPTVRISLSETAGDRGEWLTLQVEDDGPGIPEQEQVVADPDNEVSPLQHGSGIGLWAVAWIVQSFDGSLDIDADDDGSTVTIRLRSAG